MPPATQGRWDPPVTIPAPAQNTYDRDGNAILDIRGLFVLHSVLMHTGKLLWFSGHAETAFYPTVSFVFNPADPANLKLAPFPPGMDLFCCHYVQIADGRILAVGGSDYDFAANGSQGAKNICLFDPVKEEWEDTGEELNEGRWYPTPVVLGDGRVVIVSGRRERDSTRPTSPDNTLPGSGTIAETVEIFDPGAWNWEAEILTGADVVLPLYPGLHLAPNGRIYYTHTNWGQQVVEPDTMALGVTDGSGTWTRFPGRMPAQPRREEGMSVLLPPADEGKILVVGGSEAQDSGDVPIMRGGGGPSSFDHIADPADPLSAEILDVTVDPPAWSAAPGAPMRHGRINGHCVLLPDRTVLIVGGHDRYKWDSIGDGTHPSLIPELFEPGVGFTEMATMAHPRMYHSVAQLLPDGRVIVVGGADGNHPEPVLADPYPPGWSGPTYLAGDLVLNRKDYQFYEPRYFHNGPRPTIDAVLQDGDPVTQIHYGDVFTVRTAQHVQIEHIVLMRPGAPTHHTDAEQRYLELTFSRVSGVPELIVHAPTTTQTALAPPGFYMLWIVSSPESPGAGFRPSEARWIQLTGRCTLCLVATAALESDAAPGVVYLRRLRSRLAHGTPFGRRFVGAVNRVYYVFSPALAARLDRSEVARVAVRDVLVRPAIAAVRAADRATAPIPTKRVRHALLIALLVTEAAAATVLAPVWLALLGVAALRPRRRRGH